MPLSKPMFLRRARFYAALAAALAFASCAAAPRETFDLAAGAPNLPKATQLRGGSAAVVVETPTALAFVSSDRLVIRNEGGDVGYLADAQWADLAPRIVQARLIAALEKSGVDAAYPGASTEMRLQTELRRFEIDAARAAAVVEIAARLVSEQSGRSLCTATFVGEAPAPHTLAPSAAKAFDAALERAAARISDWVRAVPTRAQ